MAHLVYYCEQCPFMKYKDGKPVCQPKQEREIPDIGEQPGWCPLPEEDPMST